MGAVLVRVPTRRPNVPRYGTGPVRRHGRHGGWFIAPFLVAFLLFMIVPLGYAIYSSLYTTRLIGGTTFSGLQNYRDALGSGEFWSGLVRTVIFAAVQIPVMLVVAFFFATIFDLNLVRFGKLFRTIYFIPFAVPAVVGAVMWSFLLEPQFGPVSRLLDAVGLTKVNFFGPGMILPTVIVIVIWEWTGYNMIILYTALRSVPREIVEAAVVEGASVWTIIVRIKLPMVRPAVVMLVLINTIGALQLFTEPLILRYFESSAIPNDFTPTLFIYFTATSGQQYNLAAAAAVVLGLFIGAISVVSLLFRRRRGEFG